MKQERISWTKQKAYDEAQRFSSRTQFQKGSRRAYNAAQRNGWLDDICAHMSPRESKWTKQKVIATARKFTTRTQFQRAFNGAYKAARENGWADEAMGHMERFSKPKGYWNYERCEAAASNYESRTEFARTEHVAYLKALHNSWLDDFFPETAEPIIKIKVANQKAPPCRYETMWLSQSNVESNF